MPTRIHYRQHPGKYISKTIIYDFYITDSFQVINKCEFKTMVIFSNYLLEFHILHMVRLSTEEELETIGTVSNSK